MSRLIRAEIKWREDGWHGYLQDQEFISYGISQVVEMIEQGRHFNWNVINNKLVGTFDTNPQGIKSEAKR